MVITPAIILQLVVQFGPAAFDLIEELVNIWNKPELTKEEVLAFCALSKKSYEDYMKEAK